MTTTAPEVGKTYVSRTNPELVFYVEEFYPAEIDPNDGVSYGFAVDCCEPGDEGNMEAIGHSFTEAEWVELAFVEKA